MKVNYLTLLAAATLVLLSVAAARADESAVSALTAEANAAPTTISTTASTAPLAPLAPLAPVATAAGGTATYYQDSDPVQDFIARAGAWAVHESGSQTKVGEYQNAVQSSPFFDLEGIKSDGCRTVDLSLEGSDNDTDRGRLYYFGPHLEANLDYDRFDHQLDEKSYAGWTSIPLASKAPVSTADMFSRNDLNPGQDYAISVQEFKANFKGNLTDNLKWYVKTFGMEKEGERQANAVTHCYDATPADVATYPKPFNGFGSNAATNRQCHAITQAQHIDWQTTEVEAGLELRVGALSLNYSHMVRDFNAGDQQVINLYRSGVGLGFTSPPGVTTYSTAGYNIVPDNFTQMDRLKGHADLGCDTDIYALGYLGNTEDELNQMDRRYDGGDLRITNKSIENLTVTGYGKAYTESTNRQTTALDVLYPSQALYYQQPTTALPTAGPSTTAEPQIGRDREAVGLTTRWRPFGDDCDWVRSHFAVVGGYEYGTEHYTNANYGVLVPASGTVFNQPDTLKNTFSLGLEEKWSECFETFVRYKNISTHYPFIGVSPAVEQSLVTALNTALPTLENRVEVGGTWTTCDCLMVNAEVYLETASNDGPYAHWDSNSFPFVLSAWWSPTCQWSFNAGFAELDSWINQEVALATLGSTTPPAYFSPATFNNRSDVVSLGARYAWTPKLSTCAQFEYVHGQNATSIPVAPGGGVTPYNLGPYSLVLEDSYRISLGVDYLWQPCFTTFARYNYYNFQDLAPLLTSTAGQTNTNATGQTNMFLVGASAKF